MKKIQIYYEGGESRYVPGKVVDYMIAFAEDVELYAELRNPTWNAELDEYEDEIATYDSLKKEIISQAKKAGLSEFDLEFMYD